MGVDARTLLILLLIALLLFGASRLPQLARSLGRSARILKSEAKGLSDDDDGTEGDDNRKDGKQSAQAADASAPDQTSRAQDTGQAGYPELPAGQRIVDEDGRPVRRAYGE